MRASDLRPDRVGEEDVSLRRSIAVEEYRCGGVSLRRSISSYCMRPSSSRPHTVGGEAGEYERWERRRGGRVGEVGEEERWERRRGGRGGEVGEGPGRRGPPTLASEATTLSPPTHACQYMYFCTSKASKLSTFEHVLRLLAVVELGFELEADLLKDRRQLRLREAAEGLQRV
jgi:hypothetical protein